MLVPEPVLPRTAVSEPPQPGVYTMTFHSVWSGSIAGRIEIEAVADELHGRTRPGGTGALIGGIQGFLINTFSLGGVADGSVMQWQSPKPQGGDVVRGALQLPMIKLSTEMRHLDQPLVIRYPGGGQVFGYATLVAADHPAPPAPYDELVTEIEQALAAHLFNPQLMEAPATRELLRSLRHVAAAARDDIEFYVGFLWFARNAGFSHLGLSRTLDPAFEAELQSTRQECRNHITIRDGIAVWQARHFGTAACVARIDRIFEQIDEAQVRGLVLDLRNNMGSDYAWYRVAAHLVDAPAEVGWYVTRRQPWTDPGLAETAAMLTLDASGTRAAVSIGEQPRATLDLDHHSGALSLLRFYQEQGVGASRQQVTPCAPGYSGPLAVLVNKGTYSGAECLAAFVQEQGRGVVIGASRSAGAAMLPMEVPLSRGWLLTLPTAEYITAGGVRLENRGVLPDVLVEPAEIGNAIQAVLGGGSLVVDPS